MITGGGTVSGAGVFQNRVRQSGNLWRSKLPRICCVIQIRGSFVSEYFSTRSKKVKMLFCQKKHNLIAAGNEFAHGVRRERVVA